LGRGEPGGGQREGKAEPETSWKNLHDLAPGRA
jgi:hypothetical protein